MSISASIDETIAGLEALQAPIRSRRARDLEALGAIIAGLDDAWDPALEGEPQADPRLAGIGRQQPTGSQAPSAGDPVDDGSVNAAWARIARARLVGDAKEPGW